MGNLSAHARETAARGFVVHSWIIRVIFARENRNIKIIKMFCESSTFILRVLFSWSFALLLILNYVLTAKVKSKEGCTVSYVEGKA